jgi:ferritin-like metal-binding protein YciE
LVKGAKAPELKSALSEHLEVTKEQVVRLEQVFTALGEKAKAKHCKGMEGLLAEGAEILTEEDAGVLRDLQIIGAAQRVEHYEVAAYGTARTMAEQCGADEAAQLLASTLEEEEAADKTLTEVASNLYSEATQGEIEEEDEQPAPPKKAVKTLSNSKSTRKR